MVESRHVSGYTKLTYCGNQRSASIRSHCSIKAFSSPQPLLQYPPIVFRESARQAGHRIKEDRLNGDDARLLCALLAYPLTMPLVASHVSPPRATAPTHCSGTIRNQRWPARSTSANVLELGFGHWFGHKLFLRPCQGIGGCVHTPPACAVLGGQQVEKDDCPNSWLNIS